MSGQKDKHDVLLMMIKEVHGATFDLELMEAITNFFHDKATAINKQNSLITEKET